jgi:hypothetical protein
MILSCQMWGNVLSARRASGWPSRREGGGRVAGVWSQGRRELLFIALVIFLNNATKGRGVRLGSQLVVSLRPDLEDELLSSTMRLLVAHGCGGGWQNRAASVSHWRNNMRQRVHLGELGAAGCATRRRCVQVDVGLGGDGVGVAGGCGVPH